MSQPMPVPQDQSRSPVSGSNPRTFPIIASTSSGLPSGTRRRLGPMYQPMPVPQDQSRSPVSGSNPRTFPIIASTSSGLPSGTGTKIGVFHDSLMPPARQTSLPVSLFNATNDSLSTPAFTMIRFLCKTGEAAEPQP